MLNQLSRYGAVLPLVDGVAGGALLEVGSGSEGIARFAPDRWSITVCDLDFSDYGSVTPLADDGLRRVRGDVTHLPFAEREYDVVLALDLLEHVPGPDRRQALSELARVTRSRLIVGCPCGPTALRSDERLAAYYRLQPRSTPPWLKEHLANGFPAAEDIVEGLSAFGEVRLYPNERIGAHQVVSMLEATPLVARLTVILAKRLEAGLPASRHPQSRWAERTLLALRGRDGEPAYRRIALLDREPK